MSDKVRELVGIAIGQASLCWLPSTGDNVFDSTKALRIAEDLRHEFERMATNSYRDGVRDSIRVVAQQAADARHVRSLSGARIFSALKEKIVKTLSEAIGEDIPENFYNNKRGTLHDESMG